MPHTTHQYPFERSVCTALADIVGKVLPNQGQGTGCLVVWDSDQECRIVSENVFETWGEFADSTKRFDSYIFLDPLDDGMEYIFLAWKNIPQDRMELFVGSKFEPEDFVSRQDSSTIEYPPSWQVMF